MIDLRGVWPEWEPVEKIGEGSYGTVYKCKKIENDAEVFSAVKVITVPKNESEYQGLKIDGFTNEASKQYFADIIESFSSEIKLLEELKDQPNIVRIEDSKIIEHEDEIRWDIYIRMELLTGFRDYSEEHTMNKEEVIRLGTDICSALEACEKKKIIHRDIKPENIFVDKDGNFKLGDFGVARQLEKTNTTMSQKGTYNYMAPEVVFKKKYDKRADVYSLGMVMYKLLNNNREPFVDPDKQMIRYKDRVEAMDRRLKNERLPAPKNADENLAGVILSACEFDKEKRISSAAEFKKLLLSIGGGKKVRIKKKLNKKALLICACAAIVTVGLAFGGYMLTRPEREKAKTDEPAAALTYGEITDSGICGQDVNYAFYQESGTLVLSGSGETFDYIDGDNFDSALQLSDIPWCSYSKKIHTLKVEEGVTKIGDFLFNSCLTLNEVDLPETLIEIGNSTFLDCSGITQIVIPDNVTAIGSNAFSKCSHLDSVNMSKNIMSVGAGAFNGVGKARESDTSYYYVDNVLVGCSKTDTSYEEHFYTIYPGTRVVADRALEAAINYELIEITFPDSIVAIGEGAFVDCVSLEKINFSNGLKSIGSSAFSGCESLTEISLPESIEFVDESAFSYCKSLENIDLPDKAFSIQPYVFDETAYINNPSNWSGNCLYVGKHLVAIDENGSGEIKITDGTLSSIMCPDYYEGYSKFYIPSSVEIISYISNNYESIEVSEENKFYSSSDGILFDKQKTKLIAFPAKMNVSSYTVPDSVKEISTKAFNYADLQTIDLPNGLEKIGDGAFRSSCLTSVSIPESVKVLPEDVFDCCIDLKTITIPESVSEIKTGAFGSCESLEAIDLPDGMKYIASSLFYDSGLKDISIPSSVKFLSPSAFEKCEQLKSVKLPDDITRIPKRCFYECKSIENVKMPVTVKSIGSEAFQSCNSLTEMVFPESLEKIEGYAFFACPNLKSVTVTENVSSIGECALGIKEVAYGSVPYPDFVLNCYMDSAAYNYAAVNNISCSIIDSPTEV